MFRPVHFDIQAADPQRAMQFYGSLFGWRFQQFGEMPYWTVTTSQEGDESATGIDGGLTLRQGDTPVDGQPMNACVITIETPDANEYFAKALEAGATEVFPVRPIPGVGWVGYVKDPESNIIGLFHDDPDAPVPDFTS